MTPRWRRALRWLHRMTLMAARQLVEAPAAGQTLMGWAQRGLGVSQRNE